MTSPKAEPSARKVDLSVTVGSVALKNPVMTASGTFGYGREFAPFLDLGMLGGIAVKGVSVVPWEGNPPPRIVETPAGMINAIGLENPGVDYFLEKDLPWLRQFNVPIIVNVIGKTIDEYAEVAARLDGAPGVTAIELNISCPNIKEGGIQFGSDPDSAHRVTAAVRSRTRLPLWVKLSPNVTSVAEMGRSIEAAGADALTLINTILAMSIDIYRRRPVLANGMGGLSGPAIRPIAVRMVWQVAGAVKIPVVGMGGIMTAEDVVEFLMAGATAVQVGTANFIRPGASLDILKGLERFCLEQNVAAVRDLIGAARPDGLRMQQAPSGG